MTEFPEWKAVVKINFVMHDENIRSQNIVQHWIIRK